MKKVHLLTYLIFILLLSPPVLVSGIQTNSLPLFNEQQNKNSENINDKISVLPSFSSFFSSFPFLLSKTTDDVSSFFHPENITLSDDAYHGSNKKYAVEWWYFDTSLNQRFTLQFGIYIYTVFNTGFTTIQCNIYDQGKLIISDGSVYSLSQVSFSQHSPFIKINDKTVMNGRETMDNLSMYQISYSNDHYSFYLNLQGMTDGWKGTTSAGDWAVSLPKALVTGSLFIQNTSYDVSGIGYHDHNWNVTLSAGLNFGWLWGKTLTKHHVLTWATIFETWYKRNPLLVINKDNNGFFDIPAEQIDFSVTKIKFQDGMLIPFGFTLSAYSSQCNISLSVEIIHSDHSTVLRLINYWRYHIHTTGTITIKDYTETINEYNIAEFIRFRPY